jgi:hypothetical protein
LDRFHPHPQPAPLKQFIAPFVLDPLAHLAAPVRELVLAQLAQLELLAGDGTGLPSGDPGHWIERSRRVLQRYQALVRSG